MVVLNDLDRFHLVMDVIDRVEQLGPSAAYLKQELFEKLIEHKRYIRKHGQDLPELREWRWSPESPLTPKPSSRKPRRNPRRAL